MSHRQFLLKALELAKTGKGCCAPNPAVGAVIVKNHEVIASSYHQGPGHQHAEVVALKQLSYPLTEATLYVSLEPCNHWGKTPPCVDEIIRSGIKQVVWAYRDPNPEVASKNTQVLLEQSGISCHYLPQPEINDFYQDYQYWIETKKPYALMKIAQSLDGKIAKANQERVFLTSDRVNVFTHQHRKAADVLLTTAKTIQCDNPQFNVRLDNQVVKNPLVVLDKSLSLHRDYQVFQTAKRCIIFHDEAISAKKSYPVNSVLVPTPLVDERLDIEFILKSLGEHGFHRVWIEVGGECFTSFLIQDVINEAYVYVCPVWLGDKALSAYQDEHTYLLKNNQINWEVIDTTAIGRITSLKKGDQTCLQA